MEKRKCFWAIEVKGGVAVIELKEGEKGYKVCNIDKRYNLKIIRFALYYSNQRRFHLMPHEVDKIVEFAFNDKPWVDEEQQPEQTKKENTKMANTATFLRSDLESRNIFRGFRCGQKKDPHSYYEKKKGKYINLKVKSKEAVYHLKGWKVPSPPKN